MPAFPRLALPLAALLAALGAAPPGRACPIRLVPEDAAAWKDAVARAAARLAERGPGHDCRAVEIVVGPTGGATLAFVTTDGRGAARALEAPADLGPALEALLVTVPPIEAPTPRPPPPPPAPPAAPPTKSPPRPELHLLLGAAAGGRLVFAPVTQASPAFTFRASVSLDRWEIGATAEFAPHHRPLASTAPDGYAFESFAVGLAVGRREPVGPAALGYGLSIAVQGLREEAADLPSLSTARSLDLALPRLGLFGKVVHPRSGRVHFVADAGADAALGNLREKSTTDRQLPAFPRFGLALSLGLEVTVL